MTHPMILCSYFSGRNKSKNVRKKQKKESSQETDPRTRRYFVKKAFYHLFPKL